MIQPEHIHGPVLHLPFSGDFDISREMWQVPEQTVGEKEHI